jgi:hypothetical protein
MSAVHDLKTRGAAKTGGRLAAAEKGLHKAKRYPALANAGDSGKKQGLGYLVIPQHHFNVIELQAVADDSVFLHSLWFQ